VAINIKTKKEIAIMKSGGSILAEILNTLAESVKPGITTKELDVKAGDLCKKFDVIPAFNGYQGYQANICTGIDDVAVHGIPSPDELIVEGQIVSIDMGIIYQEFYLDSATTVPVGKVDDNAIRLLDTTKLALSKSIELSVEGHTVGDIGYAIQTIAELAGFNVITQMTGHGIGRKLHEEPYIPCFGEQGAGAKLKEGMTIAIEPMINEGVSEIEILEDGWTTLTVDGKRSAIFEHTIAVGKTKAKILTR
jgi:methionyl aminopeptidase